MTNKQRGRPFFEDRDMVKVRVNISMLPEIKNMAKECGDGNVSQGIEAAVREYYMARKSNSQ